MLFKINYTEVINREDLVDVDIDPKDYNLPVDKDGNIDYNELYENSDFTGEYIEKQLDRYCRDVSDLICIQDYIVQDYLSDDVGARYNLSIKDMNNNSIYND